MNIGFIHSYRHQKLLVINDYMLFSALNLLVAVKCSNRIYMMWSLNTSWVYDAHVGAFVATRLDAYHRAKFIKEFLNDVFVFPLAAIVVYALPRSKILGNHALLADCFEKIQNRIHDVSERMFSLPFLRIYNFFYNLPLFISKVSWVLFHNFNWLVLIKLRINIKLTCWFAIY